MERTVRHARHARVHAAVRQQAHALQQLRLLATHGRRPQARPGREAARAGAVGGPRAGAVVGTCLAPLLLQGPLIAQCVLLFVCRAPSTSQSGALRGLGHSRWVGGGSKRFA